MGLAQTQLLSVCGDDWIPYSHIKCLLVLEDKGSVDEAKTMCEQFGSSLITIQSKEEQLFFSNILEKYNNISDNVWIGLEMIENKSYKWLDGNNVEFENWDENSDKKEKCVEMSLGKSSLGKWKDALCSKKYLIICQKKQNTKTVFSEELKNLTKVIESHENKIKTQENEIKENKIENQNQIKYLKIKIQEQENEIKNMNFKNLNQETEIKNLKETAFINTIMKEVIPIGFLYTQLPNQKSPEELWPNLKWREITSEYSGLFFRAEGGESLSFGQTQQANQSFISNVYFKGCYSDSSWKDSDCDDGQYRPLLRKNWMGVDIWSKVVNKLEFYLTGGEVRPKNTAIRIFKRIQ